MKHLMKFERYSNSELDDWQQRWDQLMMDMEEEAEASGGPIAAEYSQRMEEMEKEKVGIIGVKEEPKENHFDKEYDWLKTVLNDNQLSNLFTWVGEKRDESFIRLRLNFYDVEGQDIETIIQLVNNEDFKYEWGLE